MHCISKNKEEGKNLTVTIGLTEHMETSQQITKFGFEYLLSLYLLSVLKWIVVRRLTSLPSTFCSANCILVCTYLQYRKASLSPSSPSFRIMKYPKCNVTRTILFPNIPHVPLQNFCIEFVNHCIKKKKYFRGIHHHYPGISL